MLSHFLRVHVTYAHAGIFTLHAACGGIRIVIESCVCEVIMYVPSDVQFSRKYLILQQRHNSVLSRKRRNSPHAISLTNSIARVATCGRLARLHTQLPTHSISSKLSHTHLWYCTARYWQNLAVG